MSAVLTAPAPRLPDRPMVTDALLRAAATFPRVPQAVGDARSWLGKTLTAWDVPDDDVFTAQLLLSETATNAVVHTGTGDTFRVEAWLWGAELTVSVYDPDPGADVSIPEQRDSAEHGRGLMIVKATAHKCGVDRTDTEKRTFFVLYVDGGA